MPPNTSRPGTTFMTRAARLAVSATWFLSRRPRMPRALARRATSISSMLRPNTSGCECTCMSMTPAAGLTLGGGGGNPAWASASSYVRKVRAIADTATMNFLMRPSHGHASLLTPRSKDRPTSRSVSVEQRPSGGNDRQKPPCRTFREPPRTCGVPLVCRQMLHRNGCTLTKSTAGQRRFSRSRRLSVSWSLDSGRSAAARKWSVRATTCREQVQQLKQICLRPGDVAVDGQLGAIGH